MALFSAIFLSIVIAHIVTRSASYSCGINNLDASTISTHTLSSPGNNGQEYYAPNANCKWTIKAPDWKIVELKFTTFDTYGTPTCGKSTDDVLEIYDTYANNKIGKYCGSYLPAKVVSFSTYLTLVFKSTSRYSVMKKGFRLQYKAIDKPDRDNSVCSPYNSNFANKNIDLDVFSSTTKLVRSPWYPSKYPSGIECVWILKTHDWFKRIKLKVKNVNIFNYKTPIYCNSYTSDVDSLMIFDGSSTYSSTLKTYCTSSSSSTTLTSSGSFLTIRFKSNYDNYFTGNTAGFEAEYSEIEEEESGAESGVVIGIIIGVICLVGLIVCCVCIAKRRGNPGYVQRGPAMATVQATTTTTTTNAPQYPMQPQGGYQPPPPASQVHYPPPGQGNYPPPVQGSYPPPGQGGYPSTNQAGGYPQTAPYPVPSDPPPQYPGPPAYPPQANQPYNPQGGVQQPPYPPPVDNKASAPPPF